MFNLFVVSLFIIVPFYYEVSYPVSYITSWWDFIDFNFFYKLTFTVWVVSTITVVMKTSIRWVSFDSLFYLSIFILVLLFHLFFSHTLTFFFSYFTDILWFKKTAWSDFHSLSQGPAKWGWGSEGRDSFPYHKSTTSFWFKNDAPFASALFIINFFIFISLIFLILQWLMVLRSLYSNKDISYTFLLYGLSTIIQFYYCYLFIFFFSATSVVYQFSRIALDSTWEGFIYDLITFSLNFILNNLFF